MMKRKRIQRVVLVSALLLQMLPVGVAQAEAPTRDTRTWTDPHGSGISITFSTPETYGSCETTSDVIFTQGVPASWSLVGQVTVQFILPDGSRELVPGGFYPVNTTGNLNLTIYYPPVEEWPVTLPDRDPPAREIHVDVAILVRDETGSIVLWVGGDQVNAPGTLGPNGQDWDVTCQGEGCTPGYWKNHLEAWEPTGFSPGDDFDTTFGVDLFSPDITLEQASRARGGGVKKLARHGTAALLSAAHPDVAYPLTVAEVIALVQAGDADTLVANNEIGCPLN